MKHPAHQPLKNMWIKFYYQVKNKYVAFYPQR
jgi:hypothetical protein